ncbi:signal recognition particle receptor subunit alpha [Candidatus Similichlamydia epinepheli]|uniref:signal recognition particle receptor subunit alpha n=1 Tax=Candidatus Similichlamydia epinepheli TaxID=1903953 RepID=UPI000D36DD68|nr:signal recognition particle receptor subunit alpha [Candidatus Similichlamydia epinepheli]
MFSFLRNGLTKLFRGISNKKFISEFDAQILFEQLRSLLIEADVHFSVIDYLLNRVKDHSSDAIELGSFTPSYLFDLIYKEISCLLGWDERSQLESDNCFDKIEKEILNLVESDKISSWIFCGLPGQGKTTQVAKVAYFLKNSNSSLSIGLVSTDNTRPAAGEQLRLLAEPLDFPVFIIQPDQSLDIFIDSVLKESKKRNCQLLLVDTAGCLETDLDGLNQVQEIAVRLFSEKVFFVVHGGKGQSVLESCLCFQKRIGLTGLIVTMLDGETTGGCLLSMVHRLGLPIEFEGFGEHLDHIRLFNPLSMTDRILGLGDPFNLKRKLESSLTPEQIEGLNKDALTVEFTFQDYLDKARILRSCGPLTTLLAMVPGFSNLRLNESDFILSDSIICSMTKKERKCLVQFSEKNLLRIAKGSGRSVDEVKRVIGNFEALRSTFREMGSSFDLNKLTKIMGEMKWH